MMRPHGIAGCSCRDAAHLLADVGRGARGWRDADLRAAVVDLEGGATCLIRWCSMTWPV